MTLLVGWQEGHPACKNQLCHSGWTDGDDVVDGVSVCTCCSVFVRSVYSLSESVNSVSVQFTTRPRRAEDGPVLDSDYDDDDSSNLPADRSDSHNLPSGDHTETKHPPGHSSETSDPPGNPSETKHPPGHPPETNNLPGHPSETIDPLGNLSETNYPPGNPSETNDPLGNFPETNDPPGNLSETNDQPGNPSETKDPPRNPSESGDPAGNSSGNSTAAGDHPENSSPPGNSLDPPEDSPENKDLRGISLPNSHAAEESLQNSDASGSFLEKRDPSLDHFASKDECGISLANTGLSVDSLESEDAAGRVEDTFTLHSAAVQAVNSCLIDGEMKRTRTPADTDEVCGTSSDGDGGLNTVDYDSERLGSAAAMLEAVEREDADAVQAVETSADGVASLRQLSLLHYASIRTSSATNAASRCVLLSLLQHWARSGNTPTAAWTRKQ